MTSIFSIVLFICNFLTNSWRERPKDAIFIQRCLKNSGVEVFIEAY